MFWLSFGRANTVSILITSQMRGSPQVCSIAADIRLERPSYQSGHRVQVKETSESLLSQYSDSLFCSKALISWCLILGEADECLSKK